MSDSTPELVEKALVRLATRLEKSGQHGYITMSTTDLRAIYSRAAATPLSQMRGALEACREEIVTLWHQAPGEKRPLHECLGMTFEQYAAWANPIAALDHSPIGGGMSVDPTQFGDETAANMRVYYEAHKRDKWQPGTADNLMIGLLNVAREALVEGGMIASRANPALHSQSGKAKP